MVQEGRGSIMTTTMITITTTTTTTTTSPVTPVMVLESECTLLHAVHMIVHVKLYHSSVVGHVVVVASWPVRCVSLEASSNATSS